jgi:hypothetical protein
MADFGLKRPKLAFFVKKVFLQKRGLPGGETAGIAGF